MKKTTKTSLVLLLTLIMCLTSITVFASEQTTINPRYSHVANRSFSFTASSSGGSFSARYVGLDSFARADINVKVEKRFLFAFWNDIGEWNASSTNVNGSFSHVFSLNGSGTYRATITLTITGSNGTTDTITETITSKY